MMQRFQDILLVLDNSEIEEVALRQAVDLATANQAKLTVVEVLPGTSLEMSRLMGRTWSSEFHRVLLEERRGAIEKLVEGFAAEVQVAIDVLQGTPFLEIIRRVLREGHDLVVKTVQPQNALEKMFFGSADMRLLRKCPCPVLLLKEGQKEQYQRVLAAVDIEPSEDDETMDALNQQILEMASSVAFAEFCELHIVHAWHVAGEGMLNSYRFKSQKEEVEEWIKVQRQEIKKRHDHFEKKINSLLGDKGKDYLHLKVHMVEGHADKVIPQMTGDLKADLVVMGTVARTGIPGFLMGNTAESILNQLSCSVLAIKPPGFVTPVTLD